MGGGGHHAATESGGGGGSQPDRQAAGDRQWPARGAHRWVVCGHAVSAEQGRAEVTGSWAPLQSRVAAV
jgi:hypothetical protein